jgi:hypothetical protein
MSLVRLHALVLVASLAVSVGCASRQQTELKVLGVEQSERTHDGRRIKLFVEVTNNDRRPMRLERLRYVFGPSGTGEEVHGEVPLSRTVDGGSAIVVEVPILVESELLRGGDLRLRGQLITEQDQVIRAYPVRARVETATPGVGEAGTVDRARDSE